MVPVRQQRDSRERVDEQRALVHLAVDVRLDEVDAPVVPEGAPLHVHGHVPHGRVRRLPAPHAARALHVAPVRAGAQDHAHLHAAVALSARHQRAYTIIIVTLLLNKMSFTEETSRRFENNF